MSRQEASLSLTLVAYYGEGNKPEAMIRLVEDVQRALEEALGPAAFRPYRLEQVHATVVGLEGRRTARGILNANFERLRGELRSMNLRMALEDVQATPLLPLTVRIAGYGKRDSYPFTSRGSHPFLRSFSIQGESAVVMGWPFDATRYPSSLDDLRRAFKGAGILHKYHASPEAVDNDLFFVLGRVVGGGAATRAGLAGVEEGLRALLSDRSPVDFELNRECLRLVAYSDAALPVGNPVFTLDDALRNLTAIESLYPGPGT
jgi:hypothetical protein